MQKETCHVTGKKLSVDRLVRGSLIRTQLMDLIKNDHPEFNADLYISYEALNRYRRLYLEELLRQEYGELDKLEKEVISAIETNELLSENIEPEIEAELTYGQKLADKIAEFGGSWIFILLFFSFLLGWIGVNVWILATRPFDPYPFILLNLILSCLAAIQAPVIMMSQNRLEQKDRSRSEHDYKIDLKAELEIRLLHEKIDHMILNQNKRLLEIQELQLDYLEEMINRNK